MNDNIPQPENLEQELRQMELATQRQLPESTQLDRETATLRAGFLALGQLLDTAAQPAAPARVSPRSLWSNHYLLGLLGAVAASLVVGAVAWQLWHPAGENQVTPNNANVAKDAPAEPPKIAVPELPAVVVQTPVAPTLTPEKTIAPEIVSTDEASELAWDDSLDDAITNAHERLWTIRHNSFSGDGVYTSFSGRVEKIGQEINGDSL